MRTGTVPLTRPIGLLEWPLQEPLGRSDPDGAQKGNRGYPDRRCRWRRPLPRPWPRRSPRPGLAHCAAARSCRIRRPRLRPWPGRWKSSCRSVAPIPGSPRRARRSSVGRDRTRTNRQRRHEWTWTGIGRRAGRCCHGGGAGRGPARAEDTPDRGYRSTSPTAVRMRCRADRRSARGSRGPSSARGSGRSDRRTARAVWPGPSQGLGSRFRPAGRSGRLPSP